MGPNIDGDGPESVALAVLAEMTAVLNERSGQMLKWQERPIHDSELRSQPQADRTAFQKAIPT